MRQHLSEGCCPLVQTSKVQVQTFELLDNIIVQKYTLNYFIIQKFNPWHVQKILFVGVELLDNKIVQTKKSIKSTHFYVLNYFIIQKFNPNKMFFCTSPGYSLTCNSLTWVCNSIANNNLYSHIFIQPEIKIQLTISGAAQFTLEVTINYYNFGLNHLASNRIVVCLVILANNFTDAIVSENPVVTWIGTCKAFSCVVFFDMIF